MAQMASTQLVVLDRQIEAQRARIALAEALRMPDVIPTATLTHDAQPEFTYGWRAGVAITLPLFTTHRAGVLVEQTTLEQLTAAAPGDAPENHRRRHGRCGDGGGAAAALRALPR